MNEPEQNQPINPDEGQEAAGAAPVSSSSSSDQSAQPEFGQYNQPEYGAMSNQYPANYNPYMYGAPEQPKSEDDAQQTAQRPQTNPYMQNGYPANPYQQPGIYPINPNDPSQNPLYGHWDSYAIISFVFALFLPVPVIPAVMGAIAMWRTKKLHMKGYALGVAALIINVLYTIAVIWMTVHGISTADLYNQMMQYMFGGSGQSGDSSSISA